MKTPLLYRSRNLFIGGSIFFIVFLMTFGGLSGILNAANSHSINTATCCNENDHLVNSGSANQNLQGSESFRQSLQAQVEGEVTDAETGETLPGVNILVKGTTMGASTDPDGLYTLMAPSLEDTLVVSFLGYQTREVPISGRMEINIALQPQAIAGEELVVVGYGEQEKVNLTGAVSQVAEEELNDRPISSLSKALQGRVPNLNLNQ